MERKLVSMVDYVLLVAKETPTLDTEQYDWFCSEQRKLESVRDYATFLRQSLELWQFVPVGEDGEVLEEPTETTSLNRKMAFEKAKSRCIFEGFEVIETIDEYCRMTNKGSHFVFDSNHKCLMRDSKMLSIIEDLIPYGLTLTENALK